MATELYRRRRERVLKEIAAGPHGRGLAIIPASVLERRSHDVDYPFHQDPDFRYLTGYPEPDAVAVLRPGHEHPFTLFVLARSPELETWTGRRFGVERAKELFGADATYCIEELASALPEILRGYDALYYRSGLRPDLDRAIDGALASLRARTRDGASVPWAIVDPATVVHTHRLIKEPEEIDALRRAVKVSVDAHAAAMRFVRPGVREGDVQAVLEYVFMRGGAEGVGFQTVVASGDNACILHYPEKTSELRDGDLVLMDAGALVDGFSGDITRTIPISGRYSPPQRRLYEAVLEAHHAAIAAARPGARISDCHDVAVRVLTEGMVSLGLLSGDPGALVEEGSFRKYYMHRTSHWLGMDVHDVGPYFGGDGQGRRLEAGVALTIEPGIYVPPDDMDAPEEYRGLGVRIEDDILITSEGTENLSAALPTAAEEIEALMREQLVLPS